MGEVIWGHDFSRKGGQPIRTREDAVDAMAAEFAKMLEEGDTLMVIPEHNGGHSAPYTLTCQNGETLNVWPVEPPADCPA